MQLMLHIPSPNQKWDAIQGILGQRNETQEHLPSEKIWVFIYFRQKLAGEKVSSTKKFRLRSITTLPVQLNKKQTDSTKTFVEKERQS